MKTRFVTYAAAGLLTLGSVCASQPAFAADGPSGGDTTEKIPHIKTGRAVPMPHYWQPDGPWATPPRIPVHVVTGPRLDNEFCASGTPQLVTICLDLKQLLRLLRFGA